MTMLDSTPNPGSVFYIIPGSYNENDITDEVGGWYFKDETMDVVGPFHTERAAEAALDIYVEQLNKKRKT